jgi:hypothetical protein
MSAAAGFPLAPPGRVHHLRPVPAGDTDFDREEHAAMAAPGNALPDPRMVVLATRIQAVFLRDGLSLADPDTAQAYRVTLEAAQLVISGAAATGIIDDDAHETLTGMLTAAHDVPDVL